MEDDFIEFIKAFSILIGILILFYLLPKLFEALEWIDDKIYPNRYSGVPRFINPPPTPPRPGTAKKHIRTQYADQIKITGFIISSEED